MMNSFQITRYVFLLCLLFLLSEKQAVALSEKQAVAIPSLRLLAEEREIEIGTAVNGDVLEKDPVYEYAFATQFNMGTPELSFVFRYVHPKPGTYDFTYSDLVVNFAEAHGIKVHGHSLVWHHRTTLPNWLKWRRWTRDELIAILEDHIKTVVGRYKGRIKSWDVFNEALGLTGSMRTFWLNRIGPEVIDMAFRWAHEADPDALLFYKDYAVTGKRADLIYELVSGLLQRGVPIHGVNIQTHIFLDILDEEKLIAETAYNMKRLSALGLQVNIAEFEVPIRLPATGDELQAQASIYGDALRLCLCSSSCKVFEMWGFTDRYSWIDKNNPNWGAALISDENYIPKPAFYALVNVLAEFYDADADGIRDDNGSCTFVTNPCTGGDTTGCYDNCPDIVNPGQEDQDGDGIGDVCDICPTDPSNDNDGDGICGEVDNCPEVDNPGQEDGSCIGGIWYVDVPDGIGNACQDSDKDRLTDANELAAGTDPCIPAAEPVPDIKANGIDGTAVISRGDNLTVTISLDSGGYSDVLADWWFYVYSYCSLTKSWIPIWTDSDTVPIIDFPPQTILDTAIGLKGTFKFFFGIDVNPDGSVDTDQLVGDFVYVIVQ
jgi:endo-1,4-beta-xylanase